MHTGAGVRDARFSAQLMVCHRIMERQLSKGQFKTHMSNGDFVVSFSWVATDEPAPAANGAAPSTPVYVSREKWYHISLQYEQPWRPTYTHMVRNPSEDREESLAVHVMRRPNITQSCPNFATLWEAIGATIDNAPDNTMIAWHVLIADDRVVTHLRPWSQRVCKDPICKTDVWTAKMPPPLPSDKPRKPRKRKQAQQSGGHTTEGSAHPPRRRGARVPASVLVAMAAMR